MMNHQHYQARLLRVLILASKDQVGEALEEHVEEAGDDEPPVGFIRQPRNAQGKVRNAKIADVDAAILALSNMDNSTKMLKMARLDNHVEAAIKQMNSIAVRKGTAGQPWSSQDHGVTSSIMKLFTESVSKSDPWIPIEKCENNWMARFLLTSEMEQRSKEEKVSDTKITCGGAAPDDAESVGTVASEESREIIRQFSVPATSSGPAVQPPVLTRDASMHSVHSDRSASTHGTSSTMSIARKRLSSSLSITNNNRAVIRRRTDKSG
ncbi:hypothetical protein INT45_005626 [Circinella minor]|uniref:Uncharacterized protein n=1 Tax=Circinella minor TaxID=1195481 RepID=A0A8H7VNE6_9FUNG|nr:hypothetical protein INT45_005626 [Circinella minor]